MNRPLKSIARNVSTAFGAAVLLALAGCATDKHSEMPAFRQTCNAQTGTHEAKPASHADYFAAHYGCVNQANLRAMIDNPADLENGRALGPASGERESLGVEAYNHGKVESPKSGGSAVPTIVLPTSTGGNQ